MTKLREAVYEMDSVRGGFLLHGELIEDMFNEIAELSQDANEIKREHAMIHWDKVKRKLRLLQSIADHTRDEFQKDFALLDETTNVLFEECVKGPGVKETVSHSYPQVELQTMSPERDNEVAMSYNRKAFASEFGRDPESDEEVKTWIAGVIAKIDETEQLKKA
ncbi:hypothetical protein [Sporosarcina cascadiensis]|uniref:hypothetical protein n=1 Tax=Sporosarcina cascadiensis TaxID=2660747 RepID=UPI00129B6490|nr:hypothetical protein [Sporosarcina cascadiensis]